MRSGHTEAGRAKLSQQARALQESRLKDYAYTRPLRLAFQRRQKQGMTLADVARGLGWYDKKGRADSGRVSRTLGMRVECSRNGKYKVKRQRINWDLAERLAHILDIALWECETDE